MSTSNVELLQKLFRFKKRIEYEGVTFYLRVPGDSAIEEARKKALFASNTLRRALRDPESEEYVTYFGDDYLLTASDDTLRSDLTIRKARVEMEEYFRRTPKQTLNELPDYPSQEEQEEYELALIERDREYEETAKQYVDRVVASETERLKDAPREALEQMLLDEIIDAVCKQLWAAQYEDHLMVFAIYTDDQYRNRAFTLEDFQSLPTTVKNMFKYEVNSLLIPNDDLKNSQNPPSSP